MGWKENAIMYWKDGTEWIKVSDHNRAPLDISWERFETRNRMVDTTLRRYTVGKKRTLQCDWTSLPAKKDFTYQGKQGMSTVDSGMSGEEMEAFHNTHDGMFEIQLRKGNDEAKTLSDSTIEIVKVMITDFSKTVEKRSGAVDLWNVSVSLEEV
jgi:hypothetical protein